MGSVSYTHLDVYKRQRQERVEETSNYSSESTSTGTLADSDQLAALRDQLLGKNN